MKDDSTVRNFFSHPSIISPTHSNRWDIIIQNQEVLGLQKEILHLEKKSQERSLSDWEQKRLEEVRRALAETELGDSLPQ